MREHPNFPGIDLDNPNLCGGHGHVFPRPDGALAPCGGPEECSDCDRDQRTAAKPRDQRPRLTADEITERKVRLGLV